MSSGGNFGHLAASGSQYPCRWTLLAPEPNLPHLIGNVKYWVQEGLIHPSVRSSAKQKFGNLIEDIFAYCRLTGTCSRIPWKSWFSMRSDWPGHCHAANTLANLFEKPPRKSWCTYSWFYRSCGMATPRHSESCDGSKLIDFHVAERVCKYEPWCFQKSLPTLRATRDV